MRAPITNFVFLGVMFRILGVMFRILGVLIGALSLTLTTMLRGLN